MFEFFPAPREPGVAADPQRSAEYFNWAYREEATRVGNPAGPEQLALRRQITIAIRDGTACDASRTREEQFRAHILRDPRVSAPGREVFDTPVSHAFTIGSDEFIAGAPDSVAEEVVAQCRECGAGHFLAIFDRAAPREQLASAWELFGTAVIPMLRQASVE